MVAFLNQICVPILIVVAVLAIVIFVICVIKKFVSLAIGIAILSFVIPLLFTVFWGDGYSYISEIAAYLTPRNQRQLEEAYAYYKIRDAENQIINYDLVSDKITDLFSSAKEIEKETAQDTADYVKERVKSWLSQPPLSPNTETGPGP